MSEGIVRFALVLQEFWALIHYHRRFSFRCGVHDCGNVFKKAMKDLHALGLNGVEGKRVLDLGCGQRFPFALQCAAAGARVTAFDLEYINPDPLLLAMLKTLEHNGWKRAFKSFCRRLLFDVSYYKALESSAGTPLRKYIPLIDFVTGDSRARRYPLPSHTFDLIAANAVLEHVNDVSNVAAEVHRLLRHQGYFYGMIHNFYCLSGGHNPGWIYPDEQMPDGVEPWDHLRKRRFGSWPGLNRLKPEEYRGAFSQDLDILLFEGRDVNHDPGGLEGETYLTDELSRELGAYPRDLLLTRCWCIICQKR